VRAYTFGVGIEMSETLRIAVIGGLGSFGIYFFLKSTYEFILMLPEVKKRRSNTILNLLPFLAPFASGLYTDKGNAHRLDFIKYLTRSFMCFGVAALVIFLLKVIR